MSERDIDKSPFIETVIRQNRAEAVEKVASEIGVGVERIAVEGQRHNTTSWGREAIVPQGMIQIRINSGRRNMTDFWKRVDSLVPPIKR